MSEKLECAFEGKLFKEKTDRCFLASTNYIIPCKKSVCPIWQIMLSLKNQHNTSKGEK